MWERECYITTGLCPGNTREANCPQLKCAGPFAGSSTFSETAPSLLNPKAVAELPGAVQCQLQETATRKYSFQMLRASD